MEFTFTITPNEQAILLIDQLMESYTELYDIPCAQEICFVMHELVINAVEAMEKERRTEPIELHMHYTYGQLQMTVTDVAKGIPKEQWPDVLDTAVESEDYGDRGRGFLFIQHMVDQLWFEQLSGGRFLVGATKKFVMAEEK